MITKLATLIESTIAQLDECGCYRTDADRWDMAFTLKHALDGWLSAVCADPPPGFLPFTHCGVFSSSHPHFASALVPLDLVFAKLLHEHELCDDDLTAETAEHALLEARHGQTLGLAAQLRAWLPITIGGWQLSRNSGRRAAFLKWFPGSSGPDGAAWELVDLALPIPVVPEDFQPVIAPLLRDNIEPPLVSLMGVPFLTVDETSVIGGAMLPVVMVGELH